VHRGFQHEALFYADDAQFLAGTVDFVVDGVELGQHCLVLLRPERMAPLVDALTAELGRALDGVQLVDMETRGRNPAHLLPVWREFIEVQGPVAPLRGLGEPIWPGRSAAAAAECALNEALFNTTTDPDLPLWVRCPYDVSGLDPTVVEDARRSHPGLVEDGELRGSRSYAGVLLVEELFAAELPAPPPARLEVRFGADDLARLRRLVLDRADALAVTGCRADDLVLAVTELATNSVRHGGHGGVLRLWLDDGSVVCEVVDQGRIVDPMTGRHAPTTDGEGGRGVWIANQLCDLVQVRSDENGTVVRVHLRLDP
jgi:anti-sigma regulatory factor (Ser/Thr protein kinase)